MQNVRRACEREEVCYSAVQSRCTQYVGTEGRIRSAGIKSEKPWAMGREMHEVFRPRATEQWACAKWENMRSVVPESMN